MNLGLLGVLGELGLVLGNVLLLRLGSSLLERSKVSLSLESGRGDESDMSINTTSVRVD